MRSPAPTLASRRLILEPASYRHAEFLRELAISPSTGYLWRLRGAVPNASDIDLAASSNVLAQFVMFPTSPGSSPVGVTQISDVNFKNRLAYLSMAVVPSAQRLGWTMDAGVLTVDYAFFNWDLRKLYAEVNDISFASIASGVGSLFQHVATFPEHEFIAGEYRDTHILSVDKVDWLEQRRRFVDMDILNGEVLTA